MAFCDLRKCRLLRFVKAYVRQHPQAFIDGKAGQDVKRLLVYACIGLRKISFLSASSTSLPLHSTPTLSARYCTIEISWVMKMIEIPRSRRIWSNRLITSACIDASGSLTGSSAIGTEDPRSAPARSAPAAAVHRISQRDNDQ